MLCGVLSCPGPSPGSPNDLIQRPVLIVLGDARIDVAVADERIAVFVPRYVGHLPEHSVHRGQRRLRDASVVRWIFVGRASCLRPNTIITCPCGLNLMTMSRALIHGPDIVVLVDAHGVSERPGIEIATDLSNVLAVVVELE